jgi:tight adherence protein B
MPILPIIIVSIIIVVIVAGMILAIMNQATERKKRTMQVIQGGTVVRSSKSGLKGEQDRRRAAIAKKLKDGKDDDSDDKKKKTISMLIAQAGLSITVKKFWVMSVFSMVGFIVLAQLMGQPPHVIVFATIVGLFGFPRFVLKKMAAKRQKEFLEEFPDALEATVRLLKAGMPVAEAVAMISKEYEGPVGEEMGIIYDKQKIGVALHEAAQEATYNIPLPEMQMFATGLAIQAQTGSSLSEVLMNLSNVIRSRFRLKRKVKALSSEAIASASIIAALPVLVATGMYFTNYGYISVLFTDSFGKILLTGAVTWMGVGVLMMRAMINFKI